MSVGGRTVAKVNDVKVCELGRPLFLPLVKHAEHDINLNAEEGNVTSCEKNPAGVYLLVDDAMLG